MFYAIDIDNTITVPRFCYPDFTRTVQRYIDDGIVLQDDVEGIQHYHPQFYLLPKVAITHLPMNGAVEALQGIASEGASIQYFTVRNHINPDVCKAIHENTHIWLENYGFPNPMGVRFFWDMAEKLLQASEPAETQSILVDDRPSGLFKAYQHIAENDPQKAQQIRERVTLIAFGYADIRQFSIPNGLRVLPLAEWSQLRELLSSRGKSS